MSFLEELKALGANVDEGVARIAGNEALYQKLLGSFLKTLDTHYVPLDFDGNDYAGATDDAHAIKGTSGNLSITPLYEAYTEIVDLLRSDKPEEAREVLKNILPVQEEIVQCIKKHTA